MTDWDIETLPGMPIVETIEQIAMFDVSPITNMIIEVLP